MVALINLVLSICYDIRCVFHEKKRKKNNPKYKTVIVMFFFRNRGHPPFFLPNCMHSSSLKFLIFTLMKDPLKLLPPNPAMLYHFVSFEDAFWW